MTDYDRLMEELRAEFCDERAAWLLGLPRHTVFTQMGWLLGCPTFVPIRTTFDYIDAMTVRKPTTEAASES